MNERIVVKRSNERMRKKIKYMFFDIDGTLTDGKIYIGKDGEVFKAFNCKDGYGLRNILPMLGVKPVIMTTRESVIVEKRCKELGIDLCYQGISDKRSMILELAKKWEIMPNEQSVYEELAFMGDDLNDFEAMRIYGLSVCPQDAVVEIKDMVTYVSERKAGEGAARDFIDWYKNCLKCQKISIDDN